MVMASILNRIGMIPKFNTAEVLTSVNGAMNSVSVIALDGLNCDVPTRTTPTITPVTPTNLDQTLLSYQLETESHQNEAGFVPPLIQSVSSVNNSISLHSVQESNFMGNAHFNVADTKTWIIENTIAPNLPGLMITNNSDSTSPIPPHIMSIDSGNSSSTSISFSSDKKHIGGRRPNKQCGISSEEEKRRQMRRERNKQAAARCRKRRLDHTNQLTAETEELEARKRYLEQEIESVKSKAESLKKILELHIVVCRLDSNGSPLDIKPFVTNPELSHYIIERDTNNDELKSLISTSRGNNLNGQACGIDRPRPTFLPISSLNSMKTSMPTQAAAFTEFLDSVLEKNTNLSAAISCSTCLTSNSSISSCSTQLRSSNDINLISPDANVKKLVSL